MLRCLFWQVMAVQPDKPVQRFVQIFGAVEVVWAQHLVQVPVKALEHAVSLSSSSPVL